VTQAGDLVADRLAHYGVLIREAVRTWLPAREPRRHLYDLVADYPTRGGRMLRPSLCLATARVFGASVEDALPAAVSLELMHNALLIHDDIEDGSEIRRGQPTLHRLVGVPLALNAGDHLALMSFSPLLAARARLGPQLTMRVLEEFNRMAAETAEGQAMELGWRFEGAFDVTLADYLRMVLRKTCWLTTILPLRLGALLGAGEIERDALVRLGFFLGAAFQVQDDLLNLEGDPGRYGKEIAGDLLEGKRTVPLIHLLCVASEPERARVESLLRGGRELRTESSVAWLHALLRSRGSIAYAREFAHGLAGAARHEAECALTRLADGPDKSFLLALPSWVIERA
jgi:geranylgeranyl diphosphate synthase type II